MSSLFLRGREDWRRHDLFTREEILAASADAIPVGIGLLWGVYFLIDEGEIVYVGQSTNVASRVFDHLAPDCYQPFRAKKFSRVAIHVCEEDVCMNTLELIYIGEHQPRLNRRLKNNSAWQFFRATGGYLPAWTLRAEELASRKAKRVEFRDADPLRA